jgi:hypothetical protein
VASVVTVYVALDAAFVNAYFVCRWFDTVPRWEFSLMPRTSRAASKAPRVYTATRLTPQMRERLTDAAEQSGRSLTQEIELRLEIADLVIRKNLAA